MTRIIPARFESLIEMLKRNSSFPTEPQLQSLHVAIDSIAAYLKYFMC